MYLLFRPWSEKLNWRKKEKSSSFYWKNYSKFKQCMDLFSLHFVTFVCRHIGKDLANTYTKLEKLTICKYECRLKTLWSYFWNNSVKLIFILCQQSFLFNFKALAISRSKFTWSSKSTNVCKLLMSSRLVFFQWQRGNPCLMTNPWRFRSWPTSSSRTSRVSTNRLLSYRQSVLVCSAGFSLLYIIIFLNIVHGQVNNKLRMLTHILVKANGIWNV